MSSAYLHVCVGLLLGLALRLDWRFVALAGILAETPDLDHLWGTGGRQQLHTAWYLIVLPAAVAGAGLVYAATPRVRRLLAAVPVLLLSHALLDLFPQGSEITSGQLPLLWPLELRKWSFVDRVGVASQPAALSSLGIVCGILVAATLAALGAYGLGERWRAEGKGARSVTWLAAGYAMLWPLALALLVAVRLVRPV